MAGADHAGVSGLVRACRGRCKPKLSWWTEWSMDGGIKMVLLAITTMI